MFKVYFKKISCQALEIEPLYGVSGFLASLENQIMGPPWAPALPASPSNLCPLWTGRAHSGPPQSLPLCRVSPARFIHSALALELNKILAQEPVETCGLAPPCKEVGGISAPVPPTALTTDKNQVETFLGEK